MKPIEFTRAEREAAVTRLRAFLRDELDQDISALQAEMLLDFIGRQMGAIFYNRGLYDAQAVIAARADEIVEAVAGLERPLEGR